MDREELIKKILITDRKNKRLNISCALGLGATMELDLLEKIKEFGGKAYVGEIARAMNSSLPNVSRAIKGMEKEGKVIRETYPEDRRNTVVYITEKGDEFLCDNMNKLLQFFINVLGRLSNEELELQAMLSDKLYNAYIEELKTIK